MKILFLQQVDNALGGVISVNCNLSKQFIRDGHDVKIICTRHVFNQPNIDYPKGVDLEIINDKLEWNCPRLNQSIPLLKKGKIFSIIKLIMSRRQYDKQLKKDYEIEKKTITSYNPDVIIVSHYELLDAVGEADLKKVLMHHHTTFSEVENNFSYQNYFNNYKDKIYQFVWLTKGTKEKAIRYGYQNSTYIHNFISFTSEQVSSLNHKKAVFIGRFSSEKRVDLCIELFKKAATPDWTLEIYGFGDLEAKVIEAIGDSKNIIYKQKTNSPKDVLLQSDLLMLSSSFEGFGLVIVEANECGVPAISFRCGEGMDEVIDHQKTGILILNDDKDSYVNELKQLMASPKRILELGKNAKEKAKEFEKETITKQWYALFNQVKEGK